MTTRKERAAEFLEEGYTIYVMGRNVKVTEPMKQYAMEKLSKIERFNLRIIEAQIIMDVQRNEQRVEIILKVDHIKITSHAVSDDMYASIDKAIDRIQSQIRKYHERIHEHQARGVASEEMNVSVFQTVDEQNLNEVNMDIEEENQKRNGARFSFPEIIKKETLPLKTLTYHEAIMKMELSGDPFLLFRNEEDNKLKVIYRRENDGNYALMEPEA